jgi:hypothetical protein
LGTTGGEATSEDGEEEEEVEVFRAITEAGNAGSINVTTQV